MASIFGQLFRITTWGESHGGGVGVVVDGCPPRLKLSEADIQPDLDRRRPGQSKIVTPRKESDTIQILSGISTTGKTLGTPICLWVKNEDQRSEAYNEMKDKFRPSHADFTYFAKYGIRAWQGGGRSSARETVGRVAAGAIAKKILAEKFGVEILSYVKQVQKLIADVNPDKVKLKDVESNIVRCPDAKAAEKMIRLIEKMRREGNTVGGVIEGIARGVPAGWGEPVFDKLEADLAKAIMSLPACKGFEVGSGFGGTDLTGREHNDPYRSSGVPPETSAPTERQRDPAKMRFLSEKGYLRPGQIEGAEKQKPGVFTTSNYSGGIQGGISNGMPITMRAAFKPTATIMSEQDTVNVEHENTTISGRGRHDPCVLPRAVPMVEAMVALVLVDHALRQEALGVRSLPLREGHL